MKNSFCDDDCLCALCHHGPTSCVMQLRGGADRLYQCQFPYQHPARMGHYHKGTLANGKWCEFRWEAYGGE